MPGIAIPGYLVMPDELGSPCESAGEDESNAAGIRTTARPGPSGPTKGRAVVTCSENSVNLTNFYCITRTISEASRKQVNPDC
jgi:hypothetical protein